MTGAAGFLGGYVVRELLRCGHQVRAVVRPASGDSERGPLCGSDVVAADLTAATNLDSALDGIDCVVHLAASMRGDARAQNRNTVLGTRRLVKAMGRMGIKRLVLSSSLAVYDWDAAGSRITEDSAIGGTSFKKRDTYARTKWKQDQVSRSLCAANGIALTVLRPGFIWGRGQSQPAGLGMKKGPISIVVGPSASILLTHVCNCASAFVQAVENDRAAGQTFNVVDGPPVSRWAFAGECGRRSGESAIRLPVPYTAGLIAAVTAGAIQKLPLLNRFKLPGIFVPERYRARFKPVQCDGQKIQKELGWVPPHTWQECMDLTFGPDSSPDAREKSDLTTRKRNLEVAVSGPQDLPA